MDNETKKKPGKAEWLNKRPLFKSILFVLGVLVFFFTLFKGVVFVKGSIQNELGIERKEKEVQW